MYRLANSKASDVLLAIPPLSKLRPATLTRFARWTQCPRGTGDGSTDAYGEPETHAARR